MERGKQQKIRKMLHMLEILFSGAAAALLGTIVGSLLNARLTFGFQKRLLDQQLDFQKKLLEQQLAADKEAQKERISAQTQDHKANRIAANHDTEKIVRAIENWKP